MDKIQRKGNQYTFCIVSLFLEHGILPADAPPWVAGRIRRPRGIAPDVGAPGRFRHSADAARVVRCVRIGVSVFNPSTSVSAIGDIPEREDMRGFRLRRIAPFDGGSTAGWLSTHRAHVLGTRPPRVLAI